jgi:hypothetical protein
MYRAILCAAAGAVIFGMPAKSDEVLKYHTVLRITSPNQNQQTNTFFALPPPNGR